ncbi:MAG: acyltransferase domain-containing protein, partial [Myxococcota bacterium]
KSAGSEPKRVPLGSVKSMIGHLKAAAGAASLIKIALALHHKKLPPSAGFTEAPESSPLREGYLQVNSSTRSWESEEPRRAGVSAFGFGGTNSHAVLEEYRGPGALSAGTDPDRTGKSTSVATHAASAAAPRGSENKMGHSSDELLSAVTKVFADATGYDVADLEPDFDLEADLGIDTVKQAEVLGALRERYGVASDEELRLSDVNTLRAVASYLAGRIDGGTEAAGSERPSESPSGSSDVMKTTEGPGFDGWEVLCFGADDAEGAAEKARNQLDENQWPPSQAILDARSKTPGANARLAFAANDAESAVKKAQSAGKRSARVLNAQGIFATEGQSLASKGSVAFLFPGQGSQFLGMYKDLAELFPVVRRTFEEADAVLEPLIGSKLTAYTWAEAADEEERKAAELRLRQTEICQPAMLTADVAMFRLLGTFGLTPSMVVGHSLGEYAACVASGVMTFAEALYAVSARGREMAHVEVEDNGKMASVAAGADKVEPMLADIDGYIIAANKN